MARRTAQWTRIDLVLPSDRAAAQITRRFVRRTSLLDDRTELEQLQDLRRQTLDAISSMEGEQIARATICVLADLRGQGWSVKVVGERVFVRPPEVLGDPVEEKQRVRRLHEIERDNQLRLPAVRQFIREMERRRLGPTGWVSIFSLVRDGDELSAQLRDLRSVLDPGDRCSALAQCIDPYIQFVTPEAHCQFTGIRLMDVWRYFRHTWTTPYNSTPGRNLWVLVRDRAAANHPVIGIAALGSAVVQLGPRDRWIGWTSEAFLAERSRARGKGWGEWVTGCLTRLIDSIYVADFRASGTITKVEITKPSQKTIDRLLLVAEKARKKHHQFPNAAVHKIQQRNPTDHQWRDRAMTDLFVAKRAEALARLLEARLRLTSAGFEPSRPDTLGIALTTAGGRRAVEILLREVKAAHVGVDLLDITVCGAIAPYNSLLGGKLVALLLASPEVSLHYDKRYEETSSVIASSIAGRAVRRPPKLALLGTTSLYAVSTSQYNRLRLDASEIGGRPGEYVEYKLLGETEGFGSYHLSPETARELDAMLAQHQGGRRVNSIFGEGVNPRLRKIRGGLDFIGFPSDLLLRHGTKRLVYCVALLSNFRDVLLERTSRPRHIVPRTKVADRTQAIARFWIRRWLSKRIDSDDVLNAVATHTLSYPIEHGARVRLPEIPDEMPLMQMMTGRT